MKALIVLSFTLFFIMLSGCNHKQSPQQPNNSAVNNSPDANNNLLGSKDTSLSLSWYVRGCAEKADTKFPSEGMDDEFPNLMYPLDNYIKTAGDSIVYNRYEEHLCCRKVKITTERKDNVITITEYWFGQGCKCKCSSMVHAVVYNLPEGIYQVYAVATGTDPFDDKPTSNRDTVMSQKISIGKIY